MRPTPHLFGYQRYPLEDLLAKWYTYHDEESINAQHYMASHGKDEAHEILAEVQLLAHKAEEWFTRRNELYDHGETSNHREPKWPVPDFDKRVNKLIKKLPSPGFFNALRWKEDQHRDLWLEISELVHDLKEFGWAPLEHRLPTYQFDERKWIWEDVGLASSSSATESTLSVSESYADEKRNGRNENDRTLTELETTTDDDTDADERTLI